LALVEQAELAARAVDAGQAERLAEPGERLVELGERLEELAEGEARERLEELVEEEAREHLEEREQPEEPAGREPPAAQARVRDARQVAQEELPTRAPTISIRRTTSPALSFRRFRNRRPRTSKSWRC
jgi:phytoene/squalene synthetase